MYFHGREEELRIYQLYFKTTSARVLKGSPEKDPGEEEAPASPALLLPAQMLLPCLAGECYAEVIYLISLSAAFRV